MYSVSTEVRMLDRSEVDGIRRYASMESVTEVGITGSTTSSTVLATTVSVYLCARWESACMAEKERDCKSWGSTLKTSVAKN